MPLKDWTPPQTNKPQLDWTMAVWWKTLVWKSKTPWKIGNPVTATGPPFRASYLPSGTESCTPWVQMEGTLPKTKGYYQWQKKRRFDQVWPSNSKSQIPLETFTSAGPWVRRVNHYECHLLNFFLPKQILRAWIWGTRGSRRYLLRLCFGPLCKQIILNQAMNV